MFGKKFLTSSIHSFCKYGEIMKYQIYILPKKRNKFFQHFLSDTAEDKYLNNYRVFENEIETNERFFDFAAKQISVPILSVTRGDFYLANFLRVYDNLQNKYYYYDVLDVAKQTQNIIIYNVKLDEYHTIFNNRGSDYNFLGYLRNSNTRTILDEDKIFAAPAKSIKDFTTISPDIWESNFVGVGVINIAGGGLVCLITDEQPTWKLAYSAIYTALSSGTLKHVTGNTVKNEEFEIISGYVVNSLLIKKTQETITHYESPDGVYKLYLSMSSGEHSFVFDIQNYRTNLVEFGTYSNRINLGTNGKNLNLHVKLVVLSDNIEITLYTGTQKISVTEDFAVPLQISALTSYWNTNKISVALNAISAIGGTAAGIATGNVAALVGSAKTAVDIGNEIYRASETPKDIYGKSGAELTYSFSPKGVVIWIYEPENIKYLENIKLNYGGYCNEIGVSFSSIKTRDKTNPSNNVYNYYEFSKIVSDYPQANRIAPLLLGGIEMEFLD